MIRSGFCTDAGACGCDNLADSSDNAAGGMGSSNVSTTFVFVANGSKFVSSKLSRKSRLYAPFFTGISCSDSMESSGFVTFSEDVVADSLTGGQTLELSSLFSTGRGF